MKFYAAISLAALIALSSNAQAADYLTGYAPTVQEMMKRQHGIAAPVATTAPVAAPVVATTTAPVNGVAKCPEGYNAQGMHCAKNKPKVKKQKATTAKATEMPAVPVAAAPTVEVMASPIPEPTPVVVEAPVVEAPTATPAQSRLDEIIAPAAPVAPAAEIAPAAEVAAPAETQMPVVEAPAAPLAPAAEIAPAAPIAPAAETAAPAGPAACVDGQVWNEERKGCVKAF